MKDFNSFIGRLDEVQKVSQLMPWKTHADKVQSFISDANKAGFDIDNIKFNYFKKSSGPYEATLNFNVSMGRMDELESWLDSVKKRFAPFKIKWDTLGSPSKMRQQMNLAVHFTE